MIVLRVVCLREILVLLFFDKNILIHVNLEIIALFFICYELGYEGICYDITTRY